MVWWEEVMEQRVENGGKNNFSYPKISTSIKVLIGGIAFGIIESPILQELLDVETLHEFSNNITIVKEFVKWFRYPENRILKSRDHLTIFRYLLSVFLRAYHRNVKQQVLLKLSRNDRVVVINQNGL